MHADVLDILPRKGVEDLKRFVSIAEYQKLSGLSYPTIKNALEMGKIRGIQTETGLWKIDTNNSENRDTAMVVERLVKQEELLAKLCDHLGVGMK